MNKSMITFSHVSKIFGNETAALEDISFDIDEGELVLLTGPSGSGKTTLLKLLIKEYLPTTGEIFFDDQSLVDIQGSAIDHHRQRIGIVFQDYKLIPELNVWENIALPLEVINKSEGEIESRVTDLLKLVDLADKALLFPAQLSGGEAQRISLARALATGPKLVFADEPTGNLDTKTGLGIIKLLAKINKLGTTLILATHDETILKFLKDYRCLALDHGVLVKGQSKKSTKKIDLTDDEAEKPLVKKEATQKQSALKEEKKKIKVESKDKEDISELIDVTVHKKIDLEDKDSQDEKKESAVKTEISSTTAAEKKNKTRFGSALSKVGSLLKN